MNKLLLTAGMLGLLAATGAAHAADAVRLGFMGSLSGPLGIVGEETKRGMDIALAELGGKLGGLPVKLTVVDDKAAPAEAVEGASRLIDEDHVDIVTGMNASNTFLASAPNFISAKTFIVGAVAGPKEYAGKGCNPYVFVTSFQNDDWDEVMGTYMNEHGYKNVFFIGLDYQAGWEQIAGARRSYRGHVAGQIFTPISQLDFAAEIAQIRAANPDAVFSFMVGTPGIGFVRQYAQAGLQGKVPLFGVDATSTELQWPAQGDAALGITVSTSWSAALDNPQNRKFVQEFRAKYGRNPAIFAALQYDAIKLIDAAIRKIDGRVEDKNALHDALRTVAFPSIRGKFRFNNNQYPIQDLYIERVEKDKNGTMELAVKERVAQDWQDHYHRECAMK
jgi:branched-chain amino acid transport system substrate-binding protein